jgi:hypothetical protein
MIPLLVIGNAFLLGTWLKIAAGIGRPYPVYEFGFWDGGLLFRGKRLEGRKKMILYGIAMTVFFVALNGFLVTTLLSSRHY